MKIETLWMNDENEVHICLGFIKDKFAVHNIQITHEDKLLTDIKKFLAKRSISSTNINQQIDRLTLTSFIKEGSSNSIQDGSFFLNTTENTIRVLSFDPLNHEDWLKAYNSLDVIRYYQQFELHFILDSSYPESQSFMIETNKVKPNK